MLNFKIPEFSSWEKIMQSGLPAVIYGMGNGADKVLNEFNRLHIPVAGVTASDEFVRGQQFRGYTVKKLSDFEGDFIICPAFGTSIPAVMDNLFRLSKQYKLIYPVVPVFGNEIFNRDFLEKNEEKLNEAHSLFSEKSKQIFERCVSFIFGGELEDLLEATTEKDEIFESFLCLNGDDSFLDLGAYRGDTILEFLKYSGEKYGEIIGVEPDEKTYVKMCKCLENLENFTPVCAAVSDKNGLVKFSSLAGRQSAISNTGKDKKTVTVDELCTGKSITYIKMDVEGAEFSAIRGAAHTISEKKPKLNIALYHRSEDIFEIPLAIHRLNPDYRFEIRKHPYIPCWDMNLYCK